MINKEELLLTTDFDGFNLLPNELKIVIGKLIL